ncbi:MAG TPA: peptidase S41, partial [Bacteroidales bacterium]|nr:peptidase S41 [Bacteroidales bacterium]
MKKYAILTLSLVLFIFSSCFSQSFNEQLYKFGRVLNLVNTLYVDSVQEEKLVEHAIIEMLHELDPHSIYISKEEVAAMNEPLEGSFEGIGIQFRLMEDTLLVVGVISGGP